MSGAGDVAPPAGTSSGEQTLERRIAAILEVVAVFLGGTLLARWLMREMGMGVGGVGDVDPTTVADLMPLALGLGAVLLVRYAVILLIAYAVGRWHRGRTVREWGVTRAGLPWRALLVAGVVLFAVGGFLPKLLFLLVHDLGVDGGPDRWAILSRDWDAGFWAFMAATSFLLVPIVEELFFRGYLQTRLSEDFGAASGIWITAVAFTLAHTQYLGTHPVTLGLLGSLLLGSLLLGWMRHATGSLVPPMLAHALGNVPTEGVYTVAVLLGMAIAIVMARKAIAAEGRRLARALFARAAARSAGVAVALVVAVLLVVLAAPDILPVLLVAIAVVVLVLEARERGRPEGAR